MRAGRGRQLSFQYPRFTSNPRASSAVSHRNLSRPANWVKFSTPSRASYLAPCLNRRRPGNYRRLGLGLGEVCASCQHVGMCGRLDKCWVNIDGICRAVAEVEVVWSKRSVCLHVYWVDGTSLRSLHELTAGSGPDSGMYFCHLIHHLRQAAQANTHEDCHYRSSHSLLIAQSIELATPNVSLLPTGMQQNVIS